MLEKTAMKSLLSPPLHFALSAVIAVISISVSMSFAAGKESRSATCVERTDTAKPPPFPAGPRPRAAKRYAKPEAVEGPALLQPVPKDRCRLSKNFDRTKKAS